MSQRWPTYVRFAALPFAVIGFMLAFASPSAAGSVIPDDPTSVISADYGGWVTTAQNYAQYIYYALFIFEVIAIAITTLLFRENLGEFFASVGFKVLLGGVFFWFIANGPTLSQKVINWFSNIGQTKFDGSGPDTVVIGFLGAATAFFAAANIAKVDQGLAAFTFGNGLSPLTCEWDYGFGACPVGTILQMGTEHATFILIVQGLGLMIVMGAIGVLLQFSIVTMESYLVMSVGILMVGFAGSRWTYGFSQGYFSYMINVGVKLMVTYIILGVAAKEVIPILLTAGVTLATASAIPYGASDEIATGTAAVAAVYTILTLGLLWTIPAFTAAILTGQSQSSGAAILSQAMGSFAGAAQAMAQLGAARSAGAEAASSRQQAHDVQAHAPGAGGAQSASALTQQNMGAQPVNSDQHFGVPEQSGIGVNMPAGTSGSIYNNAYTNGGSALSGGGGPTPINPRNGMSYASLGGGGGSGSGSKGSGPSLIGVDAKDYAGMSRGEFRERFGNTPDYRLLDDESKQQMYQYHAADMEDMLNTRADRADQTAQMNTAYGLGGLAAVSPRDIGQPSAVQVRTSNPDKV
ncbi:MAG: type IV secretion system protein [Candidatus Eremiobacteraeota bacterium]|nr:type IV secretion system protein [Candidatus Eremiobacteraeota bacterium]